MAPFNEEYGEVPLLQRQGQRRTSSLGGSSQGSSVSGGTTTSATWSRSSNSTHEFLNSNNNNNSNSNFTNARTTFNSSSSGLGGGHQGNGTGDHHHDEPVEIDGDMDHFQMMSRILPYNVQDPSKTLDDWVREMDSHPLDVEVSDSNFVAVGKSFGGAQEIRRRSNVGSGMPALFKKKQKLFTVTTRSQDGSSISVERTYKEFVKLYDTLLDRFPGSCPPPLPQEKVLGNGGAQRSKKLSHLGYFIQSIADHPFFRCDTCFTAFVSSSSSFHEALSSTLTQESQSEGVHRWRQALALAPVPKNPQELCNAVRQELDGLVKTLRNVKNLAKAQNEKNSAAAKAVCDLANAFSAWQTVEQNACTPLAGSVAFQSNTDQNAQSLINLQGQPSIHQPSQSGLGTETHHGSGHGAHNGQFNDSRRRSNGFASSDKENVVNGHDHDSGSIAALAEETASAVGGNRSKAFATGHHGGQGHANGHSNSEHGTIPESGQGAIVELRLPDVLDELVGSYSEYASLLQRDCGDLRMEESVLDAIRFELAWATQWLDSIDFGLQAFKRMTAGAEAASQATEAFRSAERRAQAEGTIGSKSNARMLDMLDQKMREQQRTYISSVIQAKSYERGLLRVELLRYRQARTIRVIRIHNQLAENVVYNSLSIKTVWQESGRDWGMFANCAGDDLDDYQYHIRNQEHTKKQGMHGSGKGKKNAKSALKSSKGAQPSKGKDESSIVDMWWALTAGLVVVQVAVAMIYVVMGEAGQALTIWALVGVTLGFAYLVELAFRNPQGASSSSSSSSSSASSPSKATGKKKTTKTKKRAKDATRDEAWNASASKNKSSASSRKRVSISSPGTASSASKDTKSKSLRIHRSPPLKMKSDNKQNTQHNGLSSDQKGTSNKGGPRVNHNHSSSNNAATNVHRESSLRKELRKNSSSRNMNAVYV